MEPAPSDLLENAPCWVVSFDDDSRIVYANATLLRRLGYERSRLVGQHVENIFSIGSRIFHQTHFFPLVKLHGHAEEVFTLLLTSAGEEVGALCNAVRRERELRFITDCVFIEVRERRKFEDALLEARQRAERATIAAETANRAKSSFLAVMSHELRTPLNAIGGYVQLLEMGVHGPVNEAQRETLERIDRSQRHLLRLINDVLNLARIEAGRLDYKIESVAIESILDTALPMVEPQAAAKGIHLQCAVEGEVRALGDAEKIQQVLLNLLTNAVKFTASGGTVRVEAARQAADEVFVRIVDTGSGIPAEMLEKIFEPFVQVDSTTTRGREGTGLGLAISRDLARGMNGNLRASSELGKGSAFTLTLPAAPTE